MADLSSFIHRRVVVLNQSSTTTEAARAMCERRVGSVLVSSDDGRIVGVVTDRDLVCNLLAYGADKVDREMSLAEVMTDHLEFVMEDAPLEEVINVMETNGVRRVPVMAEVGKTRAKAHKRCVGIVTLDDLMASEAIDLKRAANIVRSQVFKREQKSSKARHRSEAHATQTLNRFYHVISEKTGLDLDLSAQLTDMVLSALVRRMHYSGAAHLVAQLPSKLQDKLLDLPAGPDRNIDVSSILDQMIEQFGFIEENAQSELIKFCQALETLVDPGEIESLQTQLPEDMKALFTHVKGKVA